MEALLKRSITNNVEWRLLPKKLQDHLVNKEEYDDVIAKMSMDSQLRYHHYDLISDHFTEFKYYDLLIKHSSFYLRGFPYHLADFVVPYMNLSPSHYYRMNVMWLIKIQKPLSSIPSIFTHDMLQSMAISKKQYGQLIIEYSILQSKPGRGKALRRQLESRESPIMMQSWWTVCPGSILNRDYPTYPPEEKNMVDQLLASRSIPAGRLDKNIVTSLLRSRRAYLSVPIMDDDHIYVIDPDGFKPNEELGDPADANMHKIFLAFDGEKNVAEIAGMLHIDVQQAKNAASLFCRLGYAEKKVNGMEGEKLHPSWSDTPPPSPPPIVAAVVEGGSADVKMGEEESADSKMGEEGENSKDVTMGGGEEHADVKMEEEGEDSVDVKTSSGDPTSSTQESVDAPAANQSEATLDAVKDDEIDEGGGDEGGGTSVNRYSMAPIPLMTSSYHEEKTSSYNVYVDGNLGAFRMYRFVEDKCFMLKTRIGMIRRLDHLSELNTKRKELHRRFEKITQRRSKPRKSIDTRLPRTRTSTPWTLAMDRERDEEAIDEDPCEFSLADLRRVKMEELDELAEIAPVITEHVEEVEDGDLEVLWDAKCPGLAVVKEVTEMKEEDGALEDAEVKQGKEKEERSVSVGSSLVIKKKKRVDRLQILCPSFLSMLASSFSPTFISPFLFPSTSCNLQYSLNQLGRAFSHLHSKDQMHVMRMVLEGIVLPKNITNVCLTPAVMARVFDRLRKAVGKTNLTHRALRITSGDLEDDVEKNPEVVEMEVEDEREGEEEEKDGVASLRSFWMQESQQDERVKLVVVEDTTLPVRSCLQEDLPTVFRVSFEFAAPSHVRGILRKLNWLKRLEFHSDTIIALEKIGTDGAFNMTAIGSREGIIILMSVNLRIAREVMQSTSIEEPMQMRKLDALLNKSNIRCLPKVVSTTRIFGAFRMVDRVAVINEEGSKQKMIEAGRSTERDGQQSTPSEGMAVPPFLRWLSYKYPSIIVNAKEERQRDANGEEIQTNCTLPNPNFQEFDNLYLDMNGIIHPCTHPEDRIAPRNEEDMFMLIFEYIDRIFSIVRPRRVLYMAIDGVAPRAKMNQQRCRRFRASKEMDEKAMDIENVRQRLAAEGLPLPPKKAPEEHFDSNCITPGTPFMSRLADALRYFVHERLTNNPAWTNIQVILSDSSVPGEAKHKIIDYVRRQRASPTHDSNTVHCMCGADADLIMLGLATHEVNFNIIREEFVSNQKRPCDLCGQYGHELNGCQGVDSGEKGANEADPVSKEMNFIFLLIPVLREYLEREWAMPNLPFKYDFERVIDDWVFICLFAVNDFLPHLPSLKNGVGAIDKLAKFCMERMWRLNRYLIQDGEINVRRVQQIIMELGTVEEFFFKKRQADEERWKEREAAKKAKTGVWHGRSIQKPEFTPDTVSLRYSMADASNLSLEKPSKRVEVMLGGVGQKKEGEEKTEDLTRKRRAEESVGKAHRVAEKEEENGEEMDEAREEGWKDRYYRSKFVMDAVDVEFRREIAREYTRGLCWILKYYYQGCVSWDWYFPYHYAPFASDFDTVDKYVINFDLDTRPLKPFEHLMSVLPASSKQHLPEHWQTLMTSPESNIIDFYPTDFKTDLNGMFTWQALLPFVDKTRLLRTVKTVYPTLTDEEAARNSTGPDRLFVGSKHPAFKFLKELYEEGAGQDSIQMDSSLMYGMAGSIRPDPTSILPGVAFPSPVRAEKCHNLKENGSIVVVYKDPSFPDGFIFPARKLEGAKEPERTLKSRESNDQAQPKSKLTPTSVRRGRLDNSRHRLVKQESVMKKEEMKKETIGIDEMYEYGSEWNEAREGGYDDERGRYVRGGGYGGSAIKHEVGKGGYRGGGGGGQWEQRSGAGSDWQHRGRGGYDGGRGGYGRRGGGSGYDDYGRGGYQGGGGGGGYQQQQRHSDVGWQVQNQGGRYQEGEGYGSHRGGFTRGGGGEGGFPRGGMRLHPVRHSDDWNGQNDRSRYTDDEERYDTRSGGCSHSGRGGGGYGRSDHRGGCINSGGREGSYQQQHRHSDEGLQSQHGGYQGGGGGGYGNHDNGGYNQVGGQQRGYGGQNQSSWRGNSDEGGRSGGYGGQNGGGQQRPSWRY